MSYGVEIRNADNRLILDTQPFYTMEVVETGTFANNSVVPNMTGTGMTLFVRATTIGAFVFGRTNGSAQELMATSNGGTITYVKCRSCRDTTVGGYGLVIYDNLATPKVVFKDALKIARMFLSVNMTYIVSGTMTYGFTAALPGQNKYISANSLRATKYYATPNKAQFPSFGVSANQSICTLGVHEETLDNYDGTFPNNFTIIEC